MRVMVCVLYLNGVGRATIVQRLYVLFSATPGREVYVVVLVRSMIEWFVLL